jgi:hypothetical protein
MITFLDLETEIDGLNHWIQITSEQSDIVLFHLGVGGPIDFIDPEDHKRNVAYSVWDSQLNDIHNFAVSGKKAPWMGTSPEPMVIFPGGVKEHLWMDFDIDGEEVTIAAGHYPVAGNQEENSTFAYVISREDFLKMTEEMVGLRKYSY